MAAPGDTGTRAFPRNGGQMQLRNSETGYGLVAMALHWLVALGVFGLFGLGLWMTELTYYDAWYRLGPWWHKGIGVTLLLLVSLRLLWRHLSPPPPALSSHAPWERRMAKLAHGLLYLLLLGVITSGYLISTADGRPLEVFDRFAIPALIEPWEGQADAAGAVHLWLASTLVGLAALHALAALKHHFIDRDRTLLRMLGR